MIVLSAPAKQLLAAMTSTSRRYRIEELSERAGVAPPAVLLGLLQLHHNRLVKRRLSRFTVTWCLTRDGRFWHQQLLADSDGSPARCANPATSAT
jgi:hypothetical protein